MNNSMGEQQPKLAHHRNTFTNPFFETTLNRNPKIEYQNDDDLIQSRIIDAFSPNQIQIPIHSIGFPDEPFDLPSERLRHAVQRLLEELDKYPPGTRVIWTQPGTDTQVTGVKILPPSSNSPNPQEPLSFVLPSLQVPPFPQSLDAPRIFPVFIPSAPSFELPPSVGLLSDKPHTPNEAPLSFSENYRLSERTTQGTLLALGLALLYNAYGALQTQFANPIVASLATGFVVIKTWGDSQLERLPPRLQG